MRICLGGKKWALDDYQLKLDREKLMESIDRFMKKKFETGRFSTMKNLKLMVKLVGGFSIVALITLIVGYVGWRSISNLDGNLLEISEVRLPSIKGLLIMSEQMESMTKSSADTPGPQPGNCDPPSTIQAFCRSRKSV